MFRFFIATCVTLTVYSASQAAGDTREPQSKPGTDALSGAIDPFMLGSQRLAFLLVAGVDAEMDTTEFDADKANGNGFARPFDTWEAMGLFDSNHNSTIDWLEASEYRLTLRDVLIARHDANKNKRLDDAERDAALKELETANLAELLRSSHRMAVASSVKAPIRPVTHSPPTDQEQELLDQYHKDNARWTAEQSFRLFAGQHEPWLSDDDETRRLAGDSLFMTPDQDRDGVQTHADWELFGLRLRQSRRKNRERELMKALEKFDSNKNGKLDPNESKAIKEHWKLMGQMAMSGIDTNHDGVLDEEEKQNPIYQYMQSMDEFDEDGDGVLNDQEGESRYRTGQFNIMFREPPSPDRVNRMYGFYRGEHWREFDADGNEKLDDNEVVALNAAFTKESKGRAPISPFPDNP